MKEDKRRRLAIDIDGTITHQGYFKDFWDCTPNKNIKRYAKCKPNKKMIATINKYFDSGKCLIYLFTSRSDLYERVTKKWLDKHKVKYHYFIMNKPFYDYIIDDKALRPEEVMSGSIKDINTFIKRK